MKYLRSIFLNVFIVSTFILFFMLIINADAYAVDTCVDCHKDKKFRVENKRLFDYYQNWKDSDHDEAGIACKDCHGGDPSKEKKEEAHAKNLSVSDEYSMVYYKNIPKTCGECHKKAYEYYIESKHYKELIEVGNAPMCITCHGNPLTNVYYTSIVISTCVGCHNTQTKNNPEVIAKANHILHEINQSRGLLRWTVRHFEDINKPERLSRVNALYQKVSHSWHKFNLANADEDSKELLNELRTILREYRKRERD